MHHPVFFRLTIAIVLGFVVGYLLQGWMRQGKLTITDRPSDVSQDAVMPQLTDDQKKGWCCPAQGQPCRAEKDDVTCLGAGGYVFTYDEARCVRLCQAP